VHPCEISLVVLSEEENRGAKLARFLLAVAERVGCQKLECASMLLSHLVWNSSGGGGGSCTGMGEPGCPRPSPLDRDQGDLVET